MNESMEFRQVVAPELRADGPDKGKISGYAALFDVPYEIAWFTEVISRGAFKNTIASDDIRMLWNHDPNYVLARTTSGTLQLREDEKGLYSEAKPPDTQWARDLVESIRRKDVSQMSFGFQVLDDEWGTRDGKEWRKILKVKLFDVSPVTFPANQQTEVFVRAGWNVYRFTSPLFGLAPSNPQGFLMNNSTGIKGDPPAKTSVVTPTEPLIPPDQWVRIENNRRRFSK